jgi:NADH-quinone oxidoreductase subunit N
MLIVLAGALIGVLVEAFVGKALRPIVQLILTVATLLLALVQVFRIRGSESLSAAMGSVVFDGPGFLFQAAILIISIISVFLIADNENFTALAADRLKNRLQFNKEIKSLKFFH